MTNKLSSGEESTPVKEPAQPNVVPGIAIPEAPEVVDGTTINVPGEQQNDMPVKDVPKTHVKKVPAKRKGPGRPRKEQPTRQFEINGIVNEPKDKENVLEVVYHNPKIFKKLFALYRSYTSSEIYIHFNADHILFSALDHTGKITMLPKIFCNKLNHYYCKEPKKIRVKREEIDKIFQTIDKQHQRISFLIKELHKSVIYIILYDSEMDNDDNYELDTIPYIENPKIKYNITGEGYPVVFTWPSKHFKKRINDIDRVKTKTFTIEMEKNGKLLIKYDKTKMLSLDSIYKDNNKIKLTCELPEDDMLSVPIEVKNIKNLSQTNIGEEITVYVDKEKPILFKSILDNGVCELSVFTNVKQFNN